MCLAVLILFLFCPYPTPTNCAHLPEGFSGRSLHPRKEYTCCKLEPYASNREWPVVYCYDASPKHIFKIWQSVSLVISLRHDQYDLYQADDTHQVYEEFEAHRSSWTLPGLTWLRRADTQLNPFNNTCLGVLTTHDYKIRLDVKDVDYIFVGLFAAGVLLFFLSPLLANNPLFYYLTGISIGMMASILILFYFVLKLLPLKKPAMIGMVAGGSTLAFYVFQTFYDNIMVIMFKYHEYVIGYLLLSGLISFIVCYRFGPVSNPRSKNLIKWSLQSVALGLIFFSSYLKEVTMAVDAVLLFFYIVPIFRWVGKAAKVSKRFFKSSRPRLLTLDEYQLQGERETSKELDQLRTYCGSPDCKPWQTVLRLRDPHRFAKFMEGKAHVTKEEIELYDEECKRIMDEILTDDSEEED